MGMELKGMIPKNGDVWQHIEKQQLYRVVCLGSMFSHGAFVNPIPATPSVTFYRFGERDSPDDTYTRPLSEFLQKFTFVRSAE